MLTNTENAMEYISQWAVSDMPIYINEKLVATGKPGTYQSLDRVWSDGDTIGFTLPMGFRLSLYTGMDQVAGGLRYALEYGPILMAVVDTNGNDKQHGGPDKVPASAADNDQLDAIAWSVHLPVTAEDIIRHLKAIDNQPLHFAIEGDPHHKYMPYWQINEELFTCFPVLKTSNSYR